MAAGAVAACLPIMAFPVTRLRRLRLHIGDDHRFGALGREAPAQGAGTRML
jgi:hypothetical protein